MADDARLKIHEERYQKARALVHAIKQRHFKNLASDRNIIGAAFGRREVQGQLTDEPALVMFVMKKSPKRIIPPSHVLPRRMYIGGDCVDVDVVETGPL